MKLHVMVIYDEAIRQYGFPMSFRTHNEARREYMTIVNNPSEQSNMHLYPDQFKVYEIGTYDTETGLVSPLNGPASPLNQPPVLIFRLDELKKKEGEMDEDRG